MDTYVLNIINAYFKHHKNVLKIFCVLLIIFVILLQVTIKYTYKNKVK